MSETIPRFPLRWPQGWQRTPNWRRTSAKFSRQGERLSMHRATQRVLAELARMGVQDHDIVISTNVELRLDGMPRSDRREPDDPGVAVYWRDAKATTGMRCLAVDRYDRTPDNLAAVAATLDAMRAIERHGGAEILDRAFTGFAALPGPGPSARPWSDVFGLPANAPTVDVRTAYMRLRAHYHPDRGGDAEKFREAVAAWDEFANERSLSE